MPEAVVWSAQENDRKAAMKAVRLVKPGQPLEIQEVPVPSAGARGVLVRVKAAGICRSDVHCRGQKRQRG
jgi:D-arabinose 1-dehydrogenase-like Zn-dependent alcohol dehydrogenase